MSSVVRLTDSTEVQRFLSFSLLVVDQCIRQCQVAITVARALPPLPMGEEYYKLTESHPVDSLISKAYTRIGNAYRQMNKMSRAVNAYLLSLKITPSPQASHHKEKEQQLALILLGRPLESLDSVSSWGIADPKHSLWITLLLVDVSYVSISGSGSNESGPPIPSE